LLQKCAAQSLDAAGRWPHRNRQRRRRAAREQGWTPLLLISAAISLNLGIMNLLPIPILDGG